jgi:hypothetical protein
MSTPTQPLPTRQRIGRRVLGLLLEKALEAVPVVGPALSLGYQVVKAVKEELATEEGQVLTDEEIKASIETVTAEQRHDQVERALQTPAGRKATQHLDAVQREQVRQKLLQLPSEFDRLLAGIEQREQRAQAEQKRRQAEQEEQAVRVLRERMKQELEANQLIEAHATANEILNVRDDPEARNVEAFLNPRVSDGAGCATYLTFLTALLFTLAIVAGFFHEEHPTVGEVLVALLVLVPGTALIMGIYLIGLRLHCRQTRRVRETIGFLYWLFLLVSFGVLFVRVQEWRETANTRKPREVNPGRYHIDLPE